MSKKPTTNPRQYSPPKMQLATILSDLHSLRASNSGAALALVSARAPAAGDINIQVGNGGGEADAETLDASLEGGDEVQGDAGLARAFKLQTLHRTVKLAYLDASASNIDDILGADDVEIGAALASLSKSREDVRDATRAFGFQSYSSSSQPQNQDTSSAMKNNTQSESAHAIQNELDEDEDEELSAWS